MVDGPGKAASRAMLRAVGFNDDDFQKPRVVSSTWSMVTPCNSHIGELAELARDEADAAGGKGVVFNTITISDGIANGTEGMKYSLVSREVIADSTKPWRAAKGSMAWWRLAAAIRTCRAGDGAGAARPLAAVRLRWHHHARQGHTDIVSVFEAMGAHSRGDIDLIELKNIEETAIPGPGSCGGMYTANTMASAIEALGMSLPSSSAQNAISQEKRDDCKAAGEAVLACWLKTSSLPIS